jgi:hypothetical protein
VTQSPAVFGLTLIKVNNRRTRSECSHFSTIIILENTTHCQERIISILRFCSHGDVYFVSGSVIFLFLTKLDKCEVLLLVKGLDLFAQKFEQTFYHCPRRRDWVRHLDRTFSCDIKEQCAYPKQSKEPVCSSFLTVMDSPQ